MTKQDFIAKAVPAALASGHIWPLYAACEAALESGWGTSGLSVKYNNLFGQKTGFATKGCEVAEIPTREFLNGAWCTVTATWPEFKDWAESFKARMALLNGSPKNYGVALGAATGEDFITEVSKHWSTDPNRAKNVLLTYQSNWQALQNALIAAKAEQGANLADQEV